MSTSETVHLGFLEWLDFEEANPSVRHELVGGQVYAMTGAVRRHNLLAGKIFGRLMDAALQQGCRPYTNDMKLRTGDNGYYPDVMVVCDDPVDERYEVAPCLLVEVLSPSTETIDRREKMAAYTGLDSLVTYVLAHPDTIRLDVHRRKGNTWTQSVLGPGDSLELGCPHVELSVDDLHTGVE